MMGDQACRVYVHNLDWSVTWQQLKDHMRQAGDVAHVDLLTTGNGRSRGCAIVEFASPADAQAAISTLNDSELAGRQMLVREDREAVHKGPPPSAAAGAATGGGSAAPDVQAIYVGNLPWECTWQDLKDLVKAHTSGHIVRADVAAHADSGRSAGWGRVEFNSAGAAAAAERALQGVQVAGRAVNVYLASGAVPPGKGTLGAPLIPGGAPARPAAPMGGAGRGGGGQRQGPAACRVYVGGLPWSATWQDVKDHFRSVGSVAHVDVLMRRDGKSTGSAIVEFDSPQAARAAIATLNDTDFMGRFLNVREDREAGGGAPQPVPGLRGSGGLHVSGGAAGRGAHGDSGIVISGMPGGLTWQDLKDEFSSKFPSVTYASVSGPTGIVRFNNATDARNAVRDYNGVEFNGVRVTVRLE